MKKELGTKRTCPACHKRFYDMQSAAPCCPGCGTVIQLSQQEKEAVAATLPSAETSPIAAIQEDRPANGNSYAAIAASHTHLSNEEIAEITALDQGDESLSVEDMGKEFETKETDDENNSYLEDISELDEFDPKEEVELNRI